MMRAFALVLTLTTALARLGPTTLRITDTKGVETVVSDVAIDYGTLFSSDVDSTGIRVLRGDANVFIKWATLDTLRAVRPSDATSPRPIEFDAVLRAGKRSRVALLRKGHMKLTGISEIGAYSIDLDSVRLIVPAR